ncbi:hypothetical protein GGG87_02255 [Streptococcus sp. zg-86]|uniref:ECF transporter S component n=1 Tax=Streptococcus zhangguiae TaxID=2664091 RepID=A0A6I4RAX1_9STRE|nr:MULTISPECIES: ECF transporter S component [unclassified Streptococcus]MTB63836.1 hypothetical protein [Streptococcus sp. zg-86]MTB90146.1 hypothetical protein [Streptococcus sp. zg-36]MWV55818.1 hypothetical protein [Streptococcus sp. zg-70]QTH47899.1 ECF transporter S component [Streptococcus sp. zg-86]
MNRLTTRQLVELSLYAALILITVQFLRIPLGSQFVHLGNALVVIAVLLYGSKIGALVATIGLGLFDMLNGYAAVAWVTILESLIVCFVLHLVFEKIMHSNDATHHIILVGVVAAMTKIVSNLVKYTLINSVIGGLQLQVAIGGAVVKISGTIGTALVTVVAVPLLYPILKRIIRL